MSGSGRCSFISPFQPASRSSASRRLRSGVPASAASPVNHRSRATSGRSVRAVIETVSSCASMKLSRVCTSRVCISRCQRSTRCVSDHSWLTWKGNGRSVILLLVLPRMPPSGSLNSGLALYSKRPCQRFCGSQPGAGIRASVWWRAARRGSLPITFMAIRSPSTTVRFCGGATKASPAASASSTDPARISRSTAEALVSSPSSTVQPSEVTWPRGVTSPRL